MLPKSKTLFHTYLTIAILGLILVAYYNMLYFAGSPDIYFTTYIKTLLVNHATTALTLDIYICALVFSIWVFNDAKSLKIKWPFLYIVLCFGVSLAFAFPLYLAMRERSLEKNNCAVDAPI
jgi:hypothetical protein